MAVGPMSENTPLSISLNGSIIDGSDVKLQVSIQSSQDLSSNDSLHLFIAATMDEVGYTGYNGEPYHQDVFLGWITEGLSGELILIEKKKFQRATLGKCHQTGLKIILRQLGVELNGMCQTSQ
jgi:hypothetical protein